MAKIFNFFSFGKKEERKRSKRVIEVSKSFIWKLKKPILVADGGPLSLFANMSLKLGVVCNIDAFPNIHNKEAGRMWEKPQEGFIRVLYSKKLNLY